MHRKISVGWGFFGNILRPATLTAVSELSRIATVWRAVESAEAEWAALCHSWWALPDVSSWAGPSKAQAKRLLDEATVNLDHIVALVRRVENECEDEYRRLSTREHE